MNLIQGLITGVLALVLPLVPTAAQAPEAYAPNSTARFYLIGEKGFSYRWLDESGTKTAGLECNLYGWCAFADIVGPACADELLVTLDYFDEDDAYVTSFDNILPGAGRQRHIHVELGTSNYEGLASFEIADISCHRGLPTGNPDL